MLYAINYSDDLFLKQQKLNTKSAKKIGCADKVLSYSNNDIDTHFLDKNKTIFFEHQGGGLWLWKPYIINKTIDIAEDGDYIFYCDSGLYYVNKISILVDFLEEKNLDLLCFELPFIEWQYTKKELFTIMECDNDKYKNSNQILATDFLFKVNDFTKKFFKEYLNYAQNPKAIMNSTKKNEYNGFIEHRHDQSIFSLLCKKYNIQPYRDPNIKNYKKTILFRKIFKTDAIEIYKDYTESNYPKILHSYQKFTMKTVPLLIVNIILGKIKSFFN